MGAFRRVGQEVAFGDSLVDLADIQPIHDVAMTDALLAARAKKITFTEDRDRIAYSFYFRPLDEFEFEAQDRHVTVQAAHDSQPDSWRLAINLRSYASARRYSNKLVRYYHEVLGDEVVQAKKSVYLVLGNSAIFASPEDMDRDVLPDRKMYERPMETADCLTVAEMLSQTISRAIAAG